MPAITNMPLGAPGAGGPDTTPFDQTDLDNATAAGYAEGYAAAPSGGGAGVTAYGAGTGSKIPK